MAFDEENEVFKALMSQSLREKGPIIGDQSFETVELSHDFQQEEFFPDLTERKKFQDVDPQSTGVLQSDLNISYKTIATISIVESGAGYNNTLGAYTVLADGTIAAAKFAYNNVKTPLNIKKEIANLEKNIAKQESNVGKEQEKIEKFEDQIAKAKEKIESNPKSAKGQEKAIENYEKNIAKSLDKISQYESKIAEYEAKKNTLQNTKDFTYEIGGEEGSDLGLFIIANGDNVNKQYSGLDLENGELRFVFNYGGNEERAAKITDAAKDITLVHTHNGVDTVIKGNIYHTTERGGSTAINPDNAEHVLAGTVEGDPSTLRLGFEDLKNLGDADYNDVVVDIKIASQQVETGSYDDMMRGSDGDDTFIAGLGNDFIDGGAGIDTVDYSNYTGLIAVSLADGFASSDIQLDLASDKVDFLRNIENVIGTRFGDRLAGDAKNNRLEGGAGRDVLFGLSGSDVLLGGDGDDEIYGDDALGQVGAGEDLIVGGAGNDRMLGGGGDDIFVEGDGTDIINGGTGSDIVDYRSFTTAMNISLQDGFALDGNNVRDTLISIENILGSAQADRIVGNADNNRLEGNGGNDTLYGQGGDDTLLGGDGNDILDGGDGNDILNGGDGADRFSGGAGNDTIIGGAGADIIYGGADIDTLDYSADGAGIYANLGSFYVTDGTGARDSVTEVENIIGTAFKDTLYGDGFNNTFHGGGGDDTLYGMYGNDTLYGGEGNDLIVGDWTSETASDGNDILFGGAGNDTLAGRGGNDILDGGTGADKLYGGSGADTFVFTSTDAVDTIFDFNVAEGDKLDISDIIAGFYTDPASMAIEDFVLITENKGTAKIFVDADGGGNSWVQIAVSSSLGSTNVSELENNGTLMTF